jgi:hypothetical protein
MRFYSLIGFAALCGCGVPCSYVRATKSFDDVILAEYEVWVRSDAYDPELREIRLAEIEARRLADAEALSLCEEVSR